MRSKFIKQFLRFSPIQIFNLVFSLVTFKVTTTFLSASQMGVVNLFQNFFTLLNSVFFAWIGFVILRYYTHYRAEKKLTIFLSTIAKILIYLISGTFIVALSATFFLPTHHNVLLILGIIGLLMTILSSYFSTIFQLNNQARNYTFFNLINTILTFCCYIFCIYILKIKTESIFITSVIVGFSLLIFSIKKHKKLDLDLAKFDKEILKKTINYGLPQVITLVSVSLLNFADRYLINYYSSTQAVGEYSAAYRISEAVILIPLGMVSSIYAPFLYSNFGVKEKEERGLQNIQNFSNIYLIIFIPILLIISINPKYTAILVGSKFPLDYSLVTFIVIGNFIFGYTQILGMALQLKEKLKQLTTSIFISALFNIAINVFLIKQYSNKGAAIATMCSYIFYLALLYYYVIRNTKYRIEKRQISKIMVAASGMFAFLYLIPQDYNDLWSFNSIYKLILSCLIFYLILILAKEKNIKEIIAFIK